MEIWVDQAPAPLEKRNWSRRRSAKENSAAGCVSAGTGENVGVGLAAGGTESVSPQPARVSASAPASAQKTILFFPILFTFYRLVC